MMKEQRGEKYFSAITHQTHTLSSQLFQKKKKKKKKGTRKREEEKERRKEGEKELQKRTLQHLKQGSIIKNI